MSKMYMLWSSLATAKLIASIGFHEMALEERRKTDFARGEEVRRSKRQMDRSVAADAKIDVSIWLNDTVLIVSVELGQARVCMGVELGRERS